MPLNSEWLVLRIGGIDFFHCLVADSVWLEHAESLNTVTLCTTPFRLLLYNEQILTLQKELISSSKIAL